MAYGHAARTLATIRRLEAETAALLHSLPHLNAERLAWLHQVNRAESHVPARRTAYAPVDNITVTQL